MIIKEHGILKDTIRKNGVTLQTIVAMEEMSELIKELSKSIRGTNNHNAIVEEVADVTIVLMEIIEMYEIKASELEAQINEKLKRLRNRLDQSVTDEPIKRSEVDEDFWRDA